LKEARMPEHALSTRFYVFIGVVMILLTVLSVGVSFIPMPGFYHTVIGLCFGTTKAIMVLLFFMHVIFSPRLTWSVVLVSSFWLGILLVLAFSDYLSRGMVPFTPGH
jgi:cytochrome c oxidase subunit 4